MGLSDGGLMKELSDKIKSLPENNIREVNERDIKGTPEVMLRHCGGWKFQEGELNNILEEIQKLREIEE